jgi:restriction system protein
MSRRRKQSALNVLVDIAAMLPWWMGVSIAAAPYFWLHGIASSEVAVVAHPGKMGAFVGGHMFKTFAAIGQYLLPFVFLLGAAMSFLGRQKRERLLGETKQRGKQNALLDMSWREFEMLVGEAFRQHEFTVVETGGNGPDGGVDLVLKKHNEIYLVQCKQWKTLKVGVVIVRELFGVMAAKDAVGGYVVTAGVFTTEAKAFADGRNIELIDGAKLTQMIQEVQSSNETSPKIVYELENQPICPKCRSTMVRRSARNGSKTGQLFWGCSQYPACRGTRTI